MSMCTGVHVYAGMHVCVCVFKYQDVYECKNVCVQTNLCVYTHRHAGLHAIYYNVDHVSSRVRSLGIHSVGQRGGAFIFLAGRRGRERGNWVLANRYFFVSNRSFFGVCPTTKKSCSPHFFGFPSCARPVLCETLTRSNGLGR